MIRRPRAVPSRLAWLTTGLAAPFVLAVPLHAGEGWTFGPGARLSHPGADFRLDLTGYAQADFRSYSNWEADESDGLLLRDDRELRRLRLGFEARWRRLSLELDFDPQDDGARLKDAYAELRLSRQVRVRAGHFKLPVSPEFLTSASRLDFVERSLPVAALAPGRDLGVMVHGELRPRVSYQLGLFAGDGRSRAGRAEATAAGRLVVTPLSRLDLGVSYAHGDVRTEGDARGTQPPPKGFLGESASGFDFYVRHHVDGRRRRFGVDAEYRYRAWALRAEALHGREQRTGQGAVLDDLPEEVATGWAVSGTWLVTGEKKVRAVKPARRFPGGPGALELGVRVESVRFDDAGPDTGFSGAGNRARNIRPAADRALTAGVSWWPDAWLRLIGNVVVESYEDALLAPESGRTGRYVTLLARVQVQLP